MKRVKFTHEEKVLFPELGVTKGEVLGYYERIAPWLVPELRDRPATLERLPEGLKPGGPHFWQKNAPAHYPAWIKRARLPSAAGKPVDYVLVNDVETLLYLVNQGALTFHVYASRVGSLETPDFVLFDLDPESAPFGDVIDIARELHGVLTDEGLKPTVKTSGQSGLHVLVPWARKADHDAARAWALEIAGRLVHECVAIATTERLKKKREGKVYVDVIQNALGHHVVPPYVLRPTPTATVSTPLAWSEVRRGLDPREFNIYSIFKRPGLRGMRVA